MSGPRPGAGTRPRKPIMRSEGFFSSENESRLEFAGGRWRVFLRGFPARRATQKHRGRFVRHLRIAMPRAATVNLFLLCGHPVPASTSPLEIGLRLIQEKLERGAARKAISPAIIRVDPIERAVRLDPCSRRNPQRVVVIEF